MNSMEDLSSGQAIEDRQEFLEKELPTDLRSALNGVGYCKIAEPAIFGVVINLAEDYDNQSILSYFPEALRDNVRIKVVGKLVAL